MSVHILGIGAMGSLIAHELALASELTPVLLVKGNTVAAALKSLNSSLTLARHTDAGILYNTERMQIRRSPKYETWAPNQTITNMVVATKTYSTLNALAPYVPLMSPETNLIFLQNGMGVVPKVVDELWQNRPKPNVYHILSSHGAYKERINLTHHIGQGALTISRIPENKEVSNNAGTTTANDTIVSTEELPKVIRALLNSPNLNASMKPYPDFLVAQMEKLVVNACINPLTALMDCENGDLLLSAQSVVMMKKVIAECVACFRVQTELFDTVPEASTILSPDRLFSCVLDVCQKTAKNSSSMREDLRHLKTTEIDAITGFVTSLGLKHNIPTSMNKTLYSMILAKNQIGRAKEGVAIE